MFILKEFYCEERMKGFVSNFILGVQKKWKQ